MIDKAVINSQAGNTECGIKVRVNGITNDWAFQMCWQISLKRVDQLVKILESGSIFDIETLWLLATGRAIAG